MINSLLLPIALFAFVGADAKPTELSVGDPAPKLQVQEFVKGEPVKEFARGKIYVVEFWATWCGPCRESIPHLTELQKENKAVTFIGVSIDEETTSVKPFVERMGDKMNYRVAIDARDGEAGRSAQAWLAASGQEGIPAAFVVNGDGKIAWIGFPGEMDEPLAQIVAGHWDIAAKAIEYKKEIAQQRAMNKLQGELGALIKNKDYAGAIRRLDTAATEIDLKGEILLVELALLAGPGNDAARALKVGNRLYEDAVKDEDGGTLLMMANTLLDPSGFLEGHLSNQPPAARADSPLTALAVKAAEQGEQFNHSGNPINDAQIAMIVAKAYRAAGQAEKAADKLDEAAKWVNQSIEAANETLGQIHGMKAALGSASSAEPSAKVSQKLKNVEK